MPFNTLFSWWIGRRMDRINDYRHDALANQARTLEFLLVEGAQTFYGKRHNFVELSTYSDFKTQVPLADYGSLKPYIDRAIDGETDLLWPGVTKWFAKSSGTTADRIKILPITESALLENHYAGGKDLLAQYYHNFEGRKLYNAKHLIVGGTGKIEQQSHGVFIGDLSAIIINNLPIWTELRRTPKKEIALLENWEEKLDRMAASVLDENICIIAGVPSWTLLLLQKVLEKSQKQSIAEVWPNLELYIHGGMSFGPYQKAFAQIIGKPDMNYVENYNASEGYFGLQDQTDSKDLLLLTNSEVFYEFIPMDAFEGLDSKTVLSLEEIEPNTDYALVISTSAGLWRYIIGDTVRFTQTQPYRFVVSGRTAHFINAFGEKLIIEHADTALSRTCAIHQVQIREYTAAPDFGHDAQVGAHHWLIEFETTPSDLKAFSLTLDNELKRVNADYDAKRKGNINIGAPLITIVADGTFHRWLKQKGKLGGQHKVPRLQNNNKLLLEILAHQ
ncbi:MAG: GH3 auxin-responsive promoter family protein [Sphingomonadales bacterium]